MTYSGTPDSGPSRMTDWENVTPRPTGLGKRFASNTFWLLVGDLTSKLASFGFVLIVARELGPHAYGVFAFLTSFFPLFLIFSWAGLRVLVTKEIAHDRGVLAPVFASGLFLLCGLALTGVGVAMAVAPLLLPSQATFLVMATIALALVLDEVTSHIGSVFRAFERMKWLALRTFVNRVSSLLLAGAVVAAGGGLVEVSLAYLAGSALALAVATYALVRHFPPIRLREASRRMMSRLARNALPLMAAGVFGMLLFRIDSVMLQVFRGSDSVGLYNVAYRFLDSFLFISFAISGAALPRLARLGRSTGAKRTLEVAGSLQLAFYVPLPVGAAFAGPWVIAILFGRQYLPASAALIWLSAAATFYAIAYLVRISLIALDQRRQVAWIAAVALIFNVALNLWAIPTHGIVGAAATTLAAEVLEAFLLLIYLRRVQELPGVRLLLLPIAASAVMGVTLAISGFDGAASLALGVVVYPTALILFTWLFAPHEVRRAVALIRRLGLGRSHRQSSAEHERE